jgi:hypothetical protein
MDPARKAAEIKAFKEEQSAKLNAIVAGLIQPIKDRENRRLTEVMTNLTPYRCWDDVKPWIAEAQRQMQQTASLVGGMDFNFMDTSGWEQMPYDDDVTGLPDVSGTWKASIGGIIRDIRQSGGRISWSADYQWGPIMRHEDMQGTVSADGRIEVIITYTSPGERTQGGFSATVTVDSNGKATGIRWSNGDQYTRAP